MPSKVLLPLTIAAACLAAPAPAQSVYGDAGRSGPPFDAIGREALQGVLNVCMPNADGRLPFTRDNAPALAAHGVERVEFPPEYKIRSVRIHVGRVDYAQAAGSDGRLFFAAIPPGKLCETDVFDAPTRGQIYISMDSALRDGGWRLRQRNDGLDVIRRVYDHPHPGHSPDEVLTVTEFVYGGGPVQHLRLSAVLKSYR
jgi:hypothetical protein